MRVIDECDFCNNGWAMEDSKIRAVCEDFAERTRLVSPADKSRLCAICRILRAADFHGGYLTLNDLCGYGVRLSMGREVASEFGLKIVQERVVGWPDAANYCKLSDVVGRCDKCAFPMVLCMPDRENCKVVEEWGSVFDAVEKYISTHRAAKDKIRSIHTDGKHVRVCKWLPKVVDNERYSEGCNWHMKRPRAGLIMQRTAQLAKIIGLRACLVIVNPKDVGKTTSFKRRNLLARARKLLPALKYHRFVGWEGWPD